MIKILVISNIVMLNIAEFILKLGIQSIPELIIKQCKINNDYIERCI